MLDPQEASAGLAIGKGLFGLLGYIKGIPNSGVMSSLFDWKGALIGGSDKIIVERQELKMGDPEITDLDIRWRYHVEEKEGYTFLRFPVVESGISKLVAALLHSEKTDKRMFNAMYWRWDPNITPGGISGGDPENVRVDFVVVEYQWKSLLESISS